MVTPLPRSRQVQAWAADFSSRDLWSDSLSSRRLMATWGQSKSLAAAFPSMVIPQNRWFISWKIPFNMNDDWGYPHCRKPPYTCKISDHIKLSNIRISCEIYEAMADLGPRTWIIDDPTISTSHVLQKKFGSSQLQPLQPATDCGARSTLWFAPRSSSISQFWNLLQLQIWFIIFTAKVSSNGYTMIYWYTNWVIISFCHLSGRVLDLQLAFFQLTPCLRVELLLTVQFLLKLHLPTAEVWMGLSWCIIVQIYVCMYVYVIYNAIECNRYNVVYIIIPPGRECRPKVYHVTNSLGFI